MEKGDTIRRSRFKRNLGRPDLMGDPFPLFIGECYRMQETLLKLIKENTN